jgi:protein-disulfide isomerase
MLLHGKINNNLKNNIMFSIFKKDKFPVKTFVAISIINFLLLFFILAIVNTLFLPVSESIQQDEINDNFFINEDYTNSDPLITSIPTLKDMITGPIISDDDPSMGASDSKVVITEYSDFDCFYCKEQENVIREVIEEYKDKVRLIWKDFPDIKKSSPSYQASIAGRCAFEQGKFWEYHDMLFENSKYDNNLFLELASKANLRIKIFEDCLKDSRIVEYINNNILEAEALEINGVPFMYINDQEIMGEISKDELKKIIDEELEKKGE